MGGFCRPLKAFLGSVIPLVEALCATLSHAEQALKALMQGFCNDVFLEMHTLAIHVGQDEWLVFKVEPTQQRRTSMFGPMPSEPFAAWKHCSIRRLAYWPTSGVLKQLEHQYSWIWVSREGPHSWCTFVLYNSSFANIPLNPVTTSFLRIQSLLEVCGGSNKTNWRFCFPPRQYISAGNVDSRSFRSGLSFTLLVEEYRVHLEHQTADMTLVYS